MQIHPSTKKLIDRLYEMTLERNIEWKPGENGAVIYDTERYRVTLVGSPTEVILSSDTGAELDKADHGELTNTLLDDGTTYAEYVGELHKEAHRIARGAESAIDDVLASLDLDGDGIPDLPVPEGAGTLAAVAAPAILETAVSEPSLEDLSSEQVADAVASMADDVNASEADIPAEPEVIEPAPIVAEAPPVPEPAPTPEPAEPEIPEIVVAETPEPAPVPEIEEAPPSAPETPPAPEPSPPVAAARPSIISGQSLGLGGFGQPFAQPQAPTPAPVEPTPPEPAREPPVQTAPSPTPPIPAVPPASAPTVGYNPSSGFSTVPLSPQPKSPPPAPETPKEIPQPLTPAVPSLGSAPTPSEPSAPAVHEPAPSLPNGSVPPVPETLTPAIPAETPVVKESEIADVLGTITETVDDVVPEAPKSGLGVSALAGGIAASASGAVKSVQQGAEAAAGDLKAKSLGVIDESGEIVRSAADAVMPSEDPTSETEKPDDEPPKPPTKRFNPWR